jgi:uncharacterized membrane protein HdeD (DUF308 family)
MLTLLARNWWMVALRGLAAVLFGIAAIVWPAITLTVLVFLFGAYALVDGVFTAISAFRCREECGQWWLLLVEGLIGVVLGVLAFVWPGMTALALLYLIAVSAIVTGVIEIVAAIVLRREMEGEWLLILGGIISAIAGVLMVIWPGAGALAVLWIIATNAILFGGLLIALAFRLRGWLQESEQAMGLA